MASLVLATWWSLPRSTAGTTSDRGLLRLALLTGLLVIVVSATGAVTALGDTLYPVQSGALGTRLTELESPSAHFLERLRTLHPVLALGTSVALFALATRASDLRFSRATRGLARAVLGATIVQIALGCLNVLLSAPGWMQVLHLLVATLLWLSVVLLTAELAEPRGAT
jgi:heme A synthase